MGNHEARLDLISSQLNLLIQENKEMKSALHSFSNLLSRSITDKTLNMSALAKHYNMSKSTLQTKFYMQPNYGKSDYDAGLTRWRLKTILEWENIPVEQRKETWNNMPINKKKAYINKGA